MARVQTGAGFGTLSGRLGNAVMVNSPNGPQMRTRPVRFGQPSQAQGDSMGRLRRANELWQLLSDEEAESWNAYARRLTARNPQTGHLVAPKAVNVFVGLASKYLQLHGGHTAPVTPPTGVFLGDVVTVSVHADGSDLVFTADSANQLGVSTELLVQKLLGRHNAPRPKSYVSKGFVQFTGAGDFVRVPSFVGTYAVAVRFVDNGSGRMTASHPIGRATVTEWPGDANSA